MDACGKCYKRKGKRVCPALEGLICTRCCGRYRRRGIHCPDDCPFLPLEDGRVKREKERAASQAGPYVRARRSLFGLEDEFVAALNIERDIFAWMRRTKDSCDQDAVDALVFLERQLGSTIIVEYYTPPLGRFLMERIESAKAHEQLRSMDPPDRVALIGRLCKVVQGEAEPKGRRYFDRIERTFSRLGDEDIFRQEKGPPRTPGGIILPG